MITKLMMEKFRGGSSLKKAKPSSLLAKIAVLLNPEPKRIV